MHITQCSLKKLFLFEKYIKDFLQWLVRHFVTEVGEDELCPVRIVLVMVDLSVKMILELGILCVEGSAFWYVVHVKSLGLSCQNTWKQAMKMLRLYV